MGACITLALVLIERKGVQASGGSCCPPTVVLRSVGAPSRSLWHPGVRRNSDIHVTVLGIRRVSYPRTLGLPQPLSAYEAKRGHLPFLQATSGNGAAAECWEFGIGNQDGG